MSEVTVCESTGELTPVEQQPVPAHGWQLVAGILGHVAMNVGVAVAAALVVLLPMAALLCVAFVLAL